MNYAAQIDRQPPRAVSRKLQSNFSAQETLIKAGRIRWKELMTAVELATMPGDKQWFHTA